MTADATLRVKGDMRHAEQALSGLEHRTASVGTQMNTGSAGLKGFQTSAEKMATAVTGASSVLGGLGAQAGATTGLVANLAAALLVPGGGLVAGLAIATTAAAAALSKLSALEEEERAAAQAARDLAKDLDEQTAKSLEAVEDAARDAATALATFKVAQETGISSFSSLEGPAARIRDLELEKKRLRNHDMENKALEKRNKLHALELKIKAGITGQTENDSIKLRSQAAKDRASLQESIALLEKEVATRHSRRAAIDGEIKAANQAFRAAQQMATARAREEAARDAEREAREAERARREASRGGGSGGRVVDFEARKKRIEDRLRSEAEARHRKAVADSAAGMFDLDAANADVEAQITRAEKAADARIEAEKRAVNGILAELRFLDQQRKLLSDEEFGTREAALERRLAGHLSNEQAITALTERGIARRVEAEERAAEQIAKKQEWLQRVVQATVTTTVALTQDVLNILITEHENTAQKVAAAVLQGIGTQLVGLGTQAIFEGAAMLLRPTPDPRGAALIGVGIAAVGAGVGMGAAGTAISASVAGDSAGAGGGGGGERYVGGVKRYGARGQVDGDGKVTVVYVGGTIIGENSEAARHTHKNLRRANKRMLMG